MQGPFPLLKNATPWLKPSVAPQALKINQVLQTEFHGPATPGRCSPEPTLKPYIPRHCPTLAISKPHTLSTLAHLFSPSRLFLLSFFLVTSLEVSLSQETLP